MFHRYIKFQYLDFDDLELVDRSINCLEIDCLEINRFLVKLEKPHICRNKKDPKSAFCKKCLYIN